MIGKYKMVGSYVDYESGKVKIIDVDGYEIGVFWKKFSFKD